MGGGGGFYIAKLLGVNTVADFVICPLKHKIFTNQAWYGGDGYWSEVTEGLGVGGLWDGGDKGGLPVCGTLALQ